MLWSALLLLASSAEHAHAYSRGVSFNGCNGCHGEGEQSAILTLTPAGFGPGDTVTGRLTVTGAGSVVGVFLEPTDGTIESVSGGGLMRSAEGLTHAGPRAMSGGRAEFEFRWTAPSAPGAVRFELSSVVANGNGRSSGDGAADESFDFVYGCSPAELYRDYDGDGHGQAALPRIQCEGTMPMGYAALGDDCNDSDERAHPGADEVCNQRDDNCNGETDEDSVPVTHYPDGDNDGYYSLAERESGESFFGCSELGSGWAAEPGDCAPRDANIHPGAEDVCNSFDDDCDYDVDERVRPQCGQGWCRREAFSCNAEDCIPGDPLAETCNYFDDDCDGGVDEDSCPSGQGCFEFECVPEDEIPDPPGTTPSSGGCSASPLHAVPLGFALAAIVLVFRRRQRS